MQTTFTGAIPVLPAADVEESLAWWTGRCGFVETFRDATPPTYAGIQRGDAYVHIAGVSDRKLARTVGDQVMVRFAVKGIDGLCADYQQRGGALHPNCRGVETRPWGVKEFAAIDPNGVCVTFQE